ncbi:MAG: 30S ribosomal protein S20 [Planctomycetota bacterium]|nr:30S ribosomal protein S20 [Planctomycetota bacterium]
MPNTASSKKRVRQTETRTMRNKNRRTAMRTAIRKLGEAVAAGDKAQAQTLLVEAQGLIDRAAKQNIIHENNAANQKSRLARSVNKM